MKAKGFGNREYGYQLSGIEHSLIFEKDNTGFVRFADRSEKLFYLDPSPFLKTLKLELYVLENCPPPKKGELIEVTVSETDYKIYKDKDTYSKFIIKYIKDWKKIDPNKLTHRKPLYSFEFENFFMRPFKGKRDYIEEVGYCLSLYTVSNPQISDYEKGGLNSALLSKERHWNAVKRIMDVIPIEFKKPSSRNFYKLLDKEEIINPVNSTEVSLAYYNPLTMPVQIPIAMDVETKPISDYHKDIEYEIPMVRSYIFDALLHQPEIPKKLDSYVTNCIYNLVENVKKSGRIPYTQNLGSAIPKLSLSFARLNLEDETTKRDITEGVDLWSEMFKRAKQMASIQINPRDLYRLSENARKTYIDLHEIFGIDMPIEKVNLKNILKISEWDLEEALRELDIKGATYSPDNQHIKLLDL